MSGYSGYFSLHVESAGELRSYSATSKSGRHVLRLEVVYDSASEMGCAIEALEQLAASLKALREEARKPRLRLPAPGAFSE